MARMNDAERAFRWMFEDRGTGRIVIGQAPNAALLAFAGAMGAELFLHPVGPAKAALRLAQVASLSFWAVDEMARGVNPWRRLLGAAALAAVPVMALR